MRLTVKPAEHLEGTIKVPGDKSISHRAVMLGALARGITSIRGFLAGEDCLSTVRCLRKLGVNIDVDGQSVTVEGKGLQGFSEPEEILDVGNSGTTMRLLAGILAGQQFCSILTGDHSIRRRPMGRVTAPLREMGAVILGRQGGTLAPLVIQGGVLHPLRYQSPVASAQVKSALLLAGLYCDGWTEISEPYLSRNHTELMLHAFGAEIETEGKVVRLKGLPELNGREVEVPGDISSAAFFLVAGAIAPSARIVVESVGLNPSRDGIIQALREMGARITVKDIQVAAGEPRGTVIIESSSLQGITLGGEIIPRLIDEIPVLAVAAACASGITEIRDAAELKVKESNRISAIADGLRRLGVKIEELPDGLRIFGGSTMHGNTCSCHNDHRIAMALAVAGLRCRGETTIEEAEATAISFPEFERLLNGLRKD